MLSQHIGTIDTTSPRSKVIAEPGAEGHMIYGPYEWLEPGRYRVDYELAAEADFANGADPICATIDVVTGQGTVLVCQRLLRPSDIAEHDGVISLEFELHERREMEYRVRTNGQVRLTANDPDVTQIARFEDRHPVASPLKGAARREANEREFLDGHLRNVTGLVHVGANIGQEREYYRLLGLDVVWVEPIREIYDRLVNNIAAYPRQRAINALLTARQGEELVFRIANNNGASSSLLAMDKHVEMFPDIDYVEERTMVSTTLEQMLLDYRISTDDYQALTVDVEGAELLVLRGAGPALHRFEYVKAEVSDFSSREGNALTTEIEQFMADAGFAEIVRRPFAFHQETHGTAWDILWKRKAKHSGAPTVISPEDDVNGMDKVHYG